MKATVLCSFDNVDLAEIAVGKLKTAIPGIEQVEISHPDFEEPEDTLRILPMGMPMGVTGDNTSVGVGAASNGVFPVFMGVKEDEDSRSSDYVPRSVSVRIICREQQRSAVEAKLINLGALHVRSFRGPQL